MIEQSPGGNARGTTLNVVLVGTMGTGKSAVGRRVAESLGLRFVDTDDLIVEEAGMRIPEIFEREGEAAFRDRETAVLRKLAGCEGYVIATGGGAVLREENREILRRLGFVIWLTANVDVLARRVASNRERPLLQVADPKARIVELLAVRQPLYESVANLSVDTSELTVPETVFGLVESIRYQFSSPFTEEQLV